MKTLRLTLREVGRLFRQRQSWLFLAVAALLPIILCTDMFGLGKRYYSGTMATVLMLQPAQLALTLAGFAAALFVLLELQRMQRANMDALVGSATDLAGHTVRQTLALCTAVLAAVLAAMCALLPYTAAVAGGAFDLPAFLWIWLLLYFGGMLLCMLFAAGVYLIFRSLEAGVVLAGLLVVFDSARQYEGPFLLHPLKTSVASLSDATGSQAQFSILLYTRLVWLCAALALYLLGVLCVRRYGMGPGRSLLYNCRRAALPLAMAALVAGSALLAVYQPYFDSGPMIAYEQQIDPETGIITVQSDYTLLDVNVPNNNSVTLSDGKADLFVDKARRRLEGSVRYELRNTGGEEQNLPLTIAPGLEITAVLLDGEPMPFTKNKRDRFMASVYHVALSGVNLEGALEIRYGGRPRNRNDWQEVVFCITDRFVFLSKFVPDQPMPGRAVACTVTMDEGLVPFVSEQQLAEVPCGRAGYKSFAFSAQPFEWLVAGDYTVEHLSAGGMDVQFVYFRDQAETIQKSGAAEILGGSIDYFTERFGPLDFGGHPFVLLELDASVQGGWAVGNISMFGETMFPAGNYKSSPEAANREGGSGVGTAVHEIAHQWWGFGPSSVYIMEEEASPWSGEGLTCYSTYLYMKELFGEEYARREFTDMWQANTNRLQNAFYLTNRAYITGLSQDDAISVYGNYAGFTRYDLMPAMLMRAEELCGGEDAFVGRLAGFYEEYRQDMADYGTFLDYMGLEKEALEIG